MDATEKESSLEFRVLLFSILEIVTKGRQFFNERCFDFLCVTG
jgi:hypothetical protein